MTRNIENEASHESSIARRNKEILDSSGIVTLLMGLKNSVSDLDLNKENPVISSFKNGEDWESLILSYMWGSQSDPGDEVIHKSLTLITSVIGEKRIHLNFREVDNEGKAKFENSSFDVSDLVKKKEMLEKITSKFTTSLNSHKKV